MATHDPEWIEFYASPANTDNVICFRCTVCGKQTTVDRKRYDAGKALPSMSKHS